MDFSEKKSNPSLTDRKNNNCSSSYIIPITEFWYFLHEYGKEKSETLQNCELIKS